MNGPSCLNEICRNDKLTDQSRQVSSYLDGRVLQPDTAGQVTDHTGQDLSEAPELSAVTHPKRKGPAEHGVWKAQCL